MKSTPDFFSSPDSIYCVLYYYTMQSRPSTQLLMLNAADSTRSKSKVCGVAEERDYFEIVLTETAVPLRRRVGCRR